MRLLVVTQSLDEEDPILGFFHRWVEEFARRFESIIVICLFEGKHRLPHNVRVLSLGKESGSSRLKYVARLLRAVWRERGKYDAVFVHMNQEYVLLAGWLWKLLGKRVYMWRNHYAGSFLTAAAVGLCGKVFCTSKHSYTARFRKSVLMPVGVDAELFGGGTPPRLPHSVLFLGRMAPSKHPLLLIEALGILKKRGIPFSASFYGSPLPRDVGYFEQCKRRVQDLDIDDAVRFHDAIRNTETPAVYAAHEIFVNTSASGMYDKTLFEAAASGCLVVSASDDFARAFGGSFTFEQNPESLAERLAAALSIPEVNREAAAHRFRALAEENSLQKLVARLAQEMNV